MRILVWNIQDLYVGKIVPANPRKRKRSTLGNYNANNVNDFVAKVVACNDCWDNIPFLQAAQGAIDIFVIIEVEEVVNGAGNAVNASFDILMQAMVNSINAEAAQTWHPPLLPPIYDYVKTPAAGGPMVSAGDETVGFIYNTRTVAYQSGGIMTDAIALAPGHVLPRTPFNVNFTEVVGGAIISIVGNHAPPIGFGGAGSQYQNPIHYTNSLQTCVNAAFVAGAQLAQIANPPPAVPNIFVCGDFNCSISRTYNAVPANIGPFANLYLWPTAPNANVRMDSVMRISSVGNADNMLSSARNKLQKGLGPAPYAKTGYLNEQYDDIVFSNTIAPTVANCGVLDLIGEAKDLNGNNLNIVGQSFQRFNGWLGAFGEVSDHLPVAIQY